MLLGACACWFAANRVALSTNARARGHLRARWRMLAGADDAQRLTSMRCRRLTSKDLRQNGYGAETHSQTDSARKCSKKLDSQTDSCHHHPCHHPLPPPLPNGKVRVRIHYNRGPCTTLDPQQILILHKKIEASRVESFLNQWNMKSLRVWPQIQN